jgi:hypothetical protein
MTGQELKIIFNKDKAYLSTDRPMTFKQLNLPYIAKSFKSPAYWIIRVLNYVEPEKKIYCEIVSYHVGGTDFGSNQKLLADKLNDLEIVTFRSIDTAGLLGTLDGTTPVSFLHPKSIPINRTKNHYQVEYISKQPIKQTINETFLVPLKNVRFKVGEVSFDKKFKECRKTLEISIANNDIREEFDAVKNYFANVLKTKKIQVIVNIEITDYEVTLIDAKSPEIDKIDTQLIDNVKFEFIRSTIKNKSNIEIDKSLFTMDEYFDTFSGEKIKSNTFYNNDKELFEDLLAISDTKHYKHLRFLSSKHSHKIMKLRFVLNPFSFIFLLEGNKDYHIVWETLDTKEATYIWHTPKDINVIKLTLRKIEDIIKVIKVQGKIVYIKSTEDQFNRIYHDYSDLADGFVKWRGELESILT